MPGERTEQATPHRREKAKRDGDLLQSREFTSAAGMLAGVILLGWLGARAVESWRRDYAAFLDLGSSSRWEPSQIQATQNAMRSLTFAVLVPVGIVMAGVVSVAVLAGLVQTGGVHVNTKAMEVRFDRINPFTNARNLLSLRAAARLGKSLVPAALLAAFALQRITHESLVPPLSLARLELLGRDVYDLLLTAAWLLFGWAAVDYALEWRSRESRLRMSREELREEFKEMEGSPQIRSRIRGLQRQMRRRRVKADVSRAAVVLTNPTHYAVALGFDFSTMEAPKVLAKGRNLLAEEIKAEARWAGVAIVENPPLARSLYRSVEVGQPIPVDLYGAVAAILAYLYRRRVEEETRLRRSREAESRGAGGGRDPAMGAHNRAGSAVAPGATAARSALTGEKP